MEKIQLLTSDGVTLVGNYFSPSTPSSKAALCLHMMPATKDSWTPLAQQLTHTGFHVLAIDERGHGESTQSSTGVLDYKTFSDEDQQKKRLDVDAALAWLQSTGADLTHTCVVGASIGANLSLDALVRFPQLKSAAALSPGLDFCGIKTDPLATRLSNHQSILLLASDNDPYSYETIEQLHTLLTTPHDTWKFQALGHGTNMLTKQPELVGKLAEWIANHV